MMPFVPRKNLVPYLVLNDAQQRAYKFSECMCNLVEHCQYIKNNGTCHYRRFETGEKCERNETVIILRQSTSKNLHCPKPYQLKSCDKPECDGDCDLKGWGQWSECLQNGTKTRKRFNASASLSEYTQSCPEIEIRNCNFTATTATSISSLKTTPLTETVSKRSAKPLEVTESSIGKTEIHTKTGNRTTVDSENSDESKAVRESSTGVNEVRVSITSEKITVTLQLITSRSDQNLSQVNSPRGIDSHAIETNNTTTYAIIGVCIGIVLIVLLVLIIAFVVVKRQKAKKSKANKNPTKKGNERKLSKSTKWSPSSEYEMLNVKEQSGTSTATLHTPRSKQSQMSKSENT